MTRVSVVEWPDGLSPGSQEWDRIRAEIDHAKPELLITNEMPFGQWAPTTRTYDRDIAARWADLHETAMSDLAALGVARVLSTRPVLAQGFLVNEAFLLEEGNYRFPHHKHLFPSEPDWEEASWFKPVTYGFTPQPSGKTVVGALVCTELMFPQYARLLGQRQAQLIGVPRATGANHDLWRSAAVMAAVTAGAFVASSNRVKGKSSTIAFGGGGFIVDPHGKLLVATSKEQAIATAEIDEAFADAAKQEYPAYVSDDHLAGKSL
ncbi:carbon-nitrogen hydrolase family protein [Rhizobium sp. AN80A]|uniref:carbon-nitrogen hydrolase family protein n=1 Tax=Rhizobium sp. AN80A TaxID=3040673 RepID=UPI0024B3749A|nr:carbon-nitrogen hydrolase family protein [Rhizobium sp. AN80A]